MPFLPNLTEKKFIRGAQTHLYLAGIGYCPVNYWVEEKLDDNLEFKKRGSSKIGLLQKLGLVSIGIFLGVVFVNMRLS